MANPDILYNKLKKALGTGAETDQERVWNRLKADLECDLSESRRSLFFRKFFKLFGQDRSIRVLDFGCGGGQTVCYLRLLGYDQSYGIDIGSIHPGLYQLAALLGIREPAFFPYDGKRLPFKDAVFDFVFSEQVLEHVFALEDYYREAARVLRTGGIAFFNFPHRWIPYDSHSRTWLIHYFPRPMRRLLFRVVKRDPDRFERILNFKGVRYHRKLASHYFREIRNETAKRLRSFDDRDLNRYEGNRRIRSAVNRLVQSPIAGPLMLPPLSFFSNADLLLIK